MPWKVSDCDWDTASCFSPRRLKPRIGDAAHSQGIICRNAGQFSLCKPTSSPSSDAPLSRPTAPQLLLPTAARSNKDTHHLREDPTMKERKKGQAYHHSLGMFPHHATSPAHSASAMQPIAGFLEQRHVTHAELGRRHMFWHYEDCLAAR